MHKLVIVQIDAHMINIFPSKGEKYQIPFLKLVIIFAFDYFSHIAGGARQVLTIYFLINHAYEAGTINTIFTLTAQAMRASHPFIYIRVEILIQFFWIRIQQFSIILFNIRLFA